MSQSDPYDEDFDMCRICLVESETSRYLPFVNIMSPTNGKLKAKMRMLELLGIDVQTNDFRPKKICRYCSKSLENWDILKKKASESQIVINYIASKKVHEEMSSKKLKKRKKHITDKENCYTCNACGKTFIKKHQIAIHCKIHFGEIAYQNKARAGAITKINQKRFTCDVCNVSFKEKHHIARHCKIHTGDKPFKCTICEKLFRDQSNLLNHKYTHNMEKRFQCTQCGKKFMKNDNLLVHFRTHSHEKPYECDVCRKKFSTSGNLSRHKRTTHK